jgi:hypothetical protein
VNTQPDLRPVPDGRRRGQVCGKCGGIRTHSLRCTALQLPEGYQPGSDDEAWPACLCGLPAGTCGVCA